MLALTHGFDGFGHGLFGVLLFGVFLVLGLALFAFWLWMLVDCLMHEPSNLEKLVWVVVIVFTQLIGAFLYLVIRRRERLQAQRAGTGP